ncbi:MAG: hypothetical protein GX758_04890 [Tenericutes bacterium]|nr:hypothetical protein [Mycoplasmatota bacterium]
MLPSTLNRVVSFLIFVLLITFIMSAILMIGGSKLFKRANKNPITAYYPVLNLFTLLEIAEMSTFFGMLFFLPVINIFVISLMSFKVGKQFKCSTSYKLGLVFLPFIFYPSLSFSDKKYKVTDDQFFKEIENVKGESINLMTQEEINQQNYEEVPEVNVDSIFKSNIDLMEKVAPYKAAKIDILGMEKLENKSTTDEENIFTPIDVAPVLEPVKEEEEKEDSKFVSELEKEDEVEYIDL